MNRFSKPLNILQISTLDIAGGAEKVARNLFQGYRHYRHHSWLAVGNKKSVDPNILEIPNEIYRNFWAKFCRKLASRFEALNGKLKGSWRASRMLIWLAEPKRMITTYLGIEDFNFPGSHFLLNILLEQPDIIHCHNLHGNYFDLRVLSRLSQQVPVVLTLHDAWLLSGHCAHSFDCELWRTGCGRCPDLTIYPAIQQDATAYNWRRKQQIYSKSNLFISTPSHWLMDKVRSSMLKGFEYRVIPNGVNLDVFHPIDKRLARQRLGLPLEGNILLFASNRIKNNPWRDYETLENSLRRIGSMPGKHPLLMICLGERGENKDMGRIKIRYIPFINDPQQVAQYYQAADIYLHVTKADTFPTVILEAMACGTPVIASLIGGIPEQVEDNANGFLVPPGDVTAMSNRIEKLLNNETLRHKFGVKAVETARQRFDLKQQVNSYLEWYYEILDRWHKNADYKGKIYA